MLNFQSRRFERIRKKWFTAKIIFGSKALNSTEINGNNDFFVVHLMMTWYFNYNLSAKSCFSRGIDFVYNELLFHDK